MKTLLLSTVAAMSIAGAAVAADATLDVSDDFFTMCQDTGGQPPGFESWEYENGVLCINGSITSGTNYAFEVDMVPREVHTVILNSGGGTKAGGEQVANLIRSRGIDVLVPSWAKCLSNCVLLLSAAENATVETGARVGVHYVYTIEHNSQVQIDKELSDWYFGAIGNHMLLTDYQVYILNEGLADEYEVFSNQNFFRERVDADGKVWTSEAFMMLDEEALRRYDVID